MTRKIRQNDLHDTCDQILKGALNPQKLTKGVRDACIWYLHYEMQYSKSEIAYSFKIHRETVYNALKYEAERRALRLREKGLNVYEQYLKIDGGIDWVLRNARKNGDLKTFLDALNRKVEYMYRFGLITEQPQKIEINIDSKIKNQVDDLDIIDVQVLAEELKNERSRTKDNIRQTSETKAIQSQSE